MKQEHVKIIGEFYENPHILEMCTYKGYKGDIVLRIRTTDRRTINNIHFVCSSNNIESTDKFNHNLGTFEIFIIASDDVYSLKKD